MTILYSVVARGPTPLCSYQVGDGNYPQVIHSMLPNIPTRNNARTTYTSNDKSCMFHVMIENGIIYVCATDPECSKLKAYGFLNEIKNQFSTGSLAHRAHFAVEGELDRDFAPILQMQMEQYSRTDVAVAGGGQLSMLQSQVNDVKDVMTQNIEKVLERGERLEDLMDKTTELEASANTFKKTSSAVSRKMWFKNLKMKLILAAVVLVVLLIIILIILFKTGVLPVKKGGGGTSTTTTTTTTAPGPT